MNLTLKDKIFGFVFGTAIGDALGLGTEFMTRKEIEHRYPESLRRFDQIIRDAHRCQWEQGQWTNDTELILRFIDSLYDNGAADPMAFAKTMKDWYLEGPIDIIDQMRWVLSQDDYLQHPEETALEIWLKMGRRHASNEAIGRCALTGIAERYPERITESICKITHPAKRCICTGLIASKLANAFVHEDRQLSLEEITDMASLYDESVIPYIENTADPDISSLQLDDEETYWYTRKNLACTIWTLRHTDSPRHTLEAVVDAGGDADTNCAFALGIAGLKYGIDEMPGELIDSIYGKDRLEKQAEKLYLYMHRKFPELK